MLSKKKHENPSRALISLEPVQANLIYSPHRLVNSVQAIMSAALFYDLLVCAVVIALCSFQFITNDLLTNDTIVSMLESVYVTILSYILCNLSDGVTSKLDEIEEIFYGIKWYRLPSKHAKLIILPMQRSQLKFYFTGLGLVNCSLVVFLSVIY